MIQAICWVLIHSLWQGVLLALAGGAVILCTKRAAAAVRYRLLCGLSALFLAGIGLTFFYEWAMSTGGGEEAGEFGVSIGWLGDWCSVHGYQVVAGWVIVAGGKSLRMATGWSYMRRLRREGLAARAVWERKVDALSRQLGIRRTVKLVESSLVRVPVVIGQLKPIIYVPLGLVNHLPASEMEAVLLHELAHILRYDHVVNLVQQVVECLLFFNPGFLWVSSIMREERENSCDDIAIAHTRDRVEFVRALVRFKEHSMRGMALAFPGNRRQLLHRVLRISRQENKTLSGRERLLLLGGGMLLLCLLAARMGTMKVEERGPQEAAARSKAVVPVKPELLSVLQARQQVAQNMEWVQAQLDRLHHKRGGKKGIGGVDHLVKEGQEMAAKVVGGEMSPEAVRKEMELEAVKQEMELDIVKQDRIKEVMVKAQQYQQQQRRNEEQDKLNHDQIEKSQRQAVQDREQAERDRQQAEQDRLQAERDRQQADRDREQANTDRDLADRNKELADRNKEQAERERQQADRDRREAERNRQQAGDNRARAELERTKAKLDRQKAELDRINNH